MDNSQLRVQALQMALQAKHQNIGQPGAASESDDITTARAETYFAFLNAGKPKDDEG